MKKAVFTALAISVAACGSPPPPAEQPVEDSCAKPAFDRHLWKPASILNDLLLPKGTRVIYPGQAVTMDYRPNRLNIDVGKLGRIERVWCG